MALFSQLEVHSTCTAMITDDLKCTSYLELVDVASRMVDQISARCLVFIVCKNCVESIAAYVGCLRARIVPVLIDATIQQELFDNLLRCYQPKYVFLPNDTALQLASSEQTSFETYQRCRTYCDADYPLHEDLALLMTTSGSTGSPRLVRQSYENLSSNTASIIEYLGITSEDRPMTTLPMHYTYGLSLLNTHLSQGATIVLTELTVFDQSFWELFKKLEVTTFGGVPFTYEMLKKLRFTRMQLPSLKYLTQAGGKLAQNLCEEFIAAGNQNGVPFIIMYGQTEACARMSYLPWADASRKVGSIGVAIPGGKFWLEDENKHVILEKGVPGELVYQGPNVALGYAEDFSDLAKGDEFGGVLRTGDIATCDDEGFYTIVGRKSRFLKIHGSRINLSEAESLLQQAGFDCVCSGTDDHLIIYLAGSEELAAAKKFAAKSMHIHPKGITVKQIGSVPRNVAGKVLYHELED